MKPGIQPAQPVWARGRVRLLAAGLLGLGGAVLIEAQAQETVIAYAVPADTVGNQDFSGMLGMDFDVTNPIIITRVGVFDSGSDGLNRVIYAGLWNRETQTEILFVEFRPDDAGELVGGSRFRALPEPIRLEAGFQGSITADGYGPDEPLFNSHGVEDDVVWTTNDGNGSIQFVGSGRWGVAPGAFPDNVDGGPAARYAAGTFEYETTPAVLPGRPEGFALTPGDQAITLSWSPVLQPAPAAGYRVLRGTQAAGPFTQIAELTETEHLDSSLVNGTVYFYVVRGVTAGGLEGPDSALRSAAPYAPLPANQAIAYFTPAGIAGNSDFGGAFGMDFDVYNAVIVQQLGVFDDNSDGLKRPLTARIFDRDTEAVVAELSFLPEDPGTLIEGMRFKPLGAPLRLEAGFRGVIQADGYGAEERAGNSGTPLWTTHDGQGSLLFVGARWGADPGAYPDNADAPPANRFAAGTFLYEITDPLRPGVPVLEVLLPAEESQATLTWTEVLNPLPAAQYRVLRAPTADGPWVTAVETASTSYQDTGLENDVPVFYRVVAVGSGGELSADSNIVTVTPAPRRAGIAYVNPELQEGNQAFGGSLGMHFDVVRPIQITRLGVFDEYGDGALNLTLHAAIWNRQTQEQLAHLEFTPEDPGEPIGGSLFKTLPSPLVLPAGFQGTIVAHGYGAEERLFNTGNRPDDVALLDTFDGGSLFFVGTSAYAVAPGAFPGTPDGGPANRYAAGTFYFEPIEVTEPPVLTISRAGADTLKIEWTVGGVLQSSASITAGWEDLDGASSGVEVPITDDARFYRVR